MSFTWFNNLDSSLEAIKRRDVASKQQKSSNDGCLYVGGNQKSLKFKNEVPYANSTVKRTSKSSSHKKKEQKICERKDYDKEKLQNNVSPLGDNNVKENLNLSNITNNDLQLRDETTLRENNKQLQTELEVEQVQISQDQPSTNNLLSQDEIKAVERQFGDSETNLNFDKKHHQKIMPNLEDKLTNLTDIYNFFSQYKSKYYRNLFVKEYDICHFKMERTILISLPEKIKNELNNIPKIENLHNYSFSIREWAISILNLTFNDRYIGILALQAISITMNANIFHNFQKLILIEVPNYETASILVFIRLFVNFFESHKLNIFLHVFNSKIITTEDWLKRYKLIKQLSNKDWELYGVQALMLKELPNGMETTFDKNLYIDFNASNEWLNSQLENIDDTQLGTNDEEDYIFDY